MRFLGILLALAILAAACGSGGDSEADGESGTDSGEYEEASDGDDSGGDESDGDSTVIAGEGVIVHAADDEATTLDPAQVEPGEGGETIILQVYERLLEISSDGPDLVSAVATEVPSVDNGLISDDGLTYTFPIREAVVFHDGTDLTADDVKYSWDRVMTMSLPDGAADVLNDIVAETNVVDDATFEVTLQKPSAAFLNTAVVAMVSSIVSQDAVRGQWRRRRGRTEQIHADEHGRHRAVQPRGVEPGRERAARGQPGLLGTPANNDVRIESGATPDVRVLGLQAGEYDTIEADPSFIGDLEGAEGVTIAGEGLTVEPIHIGFNLTISDGALPEEDTIPNDFPQDPLGTCNPMRIKDVCKCVE